MDKQSKHERTKSKHLKRSCQRLLRRLENPVRDPKVLDMTEEDYKNMRRLSPEELLKCFGI